MVQTLTKSVKAKLLWPNHLNLSQFTNQFGQTSLTQSTLVWLEPCQTELNLVYKNSSPNQIKPSNRLKWFNDSVLHLGLNWAVTYSSPQFTIKKLVHNRAKLTKEYHKQKSCERIYYDTILLTNSKWETKEGSIWTFCTSSTTHKKSWPW